MTSSLLSCFTQVIRSVCYALGLKSARRWPLLLERRLAKWFAGLSRGSNSKDLEAKSFSKVTAAADSAVFGLAEGKHGTKSPDGQPNGRTKNGQPSRKGRPRPWAGVHRFSRVGAVQGRGQVSVPSPPYASTGRTPARGLQCSCRGSHAQPSNVHAAARAFVCWRFAVIQAPGCATHRLSLRKWETSLVSTIFW